MFSSLRRPFAVSLLALACFACGHGVPPAQGQASVVRVVKKGGGYQLIRNGKPFFIKGAGGDGSKTLLRDLGGNSFRTWGADNLDGQLAEAQKLGLAVTVGIWLGHKEHGFNYDDAAAVAAQKESARKAILRYKDSPALLLWGLGNEMETGQEDNVAMWNAIEDIAKMAHQLDPNHPTMTVVAEIGGNKVKHINELCPDIDIVGINSYGGGPSIGDRYKTAGGVKPYVITEFGPPGTWESGQNAWGVVPELSSTEKAKFYRATYEKGILNQPLCLGSYAFAWGNKQEATATWYGLMLSDGSRLGPIDTLSELWSGKPPANRSPQITSLTVAGNPQVKPGATVQATLAASDPDNDPIKVQWVLQGDPATYNTGGAAEAAPPTFPDAITKSDAKSATIQMPSVGGGYRLYAFVHDTHNGAAVANVALDVVGGDKAGPLPAKKAALPLVIYGASAQGDLPYTPSGYMGNAAAIHMDPASATNPHAGKTSLRVEYGAKDNWGGVVWQSPANDWGDLPGGWNLTGAKKLSFWARGEQGGEVVGFKFGLLGNDKTYSDSASAGLNATLTKEWKQYSIDVSGRDLSRIKTGFSWTLASTGQPIVFYLDDIRWE